MVININKFYLALFVFEYRFFVKLLFEIGCYISDDDDDDGDGIPDDEEDDDDNDEL